VQWHPERGFDDDRASQALFKAFLQAAGNWHKHLKGKQKDFESVSPEK
jgi:gamma-glutamyl-gamma-aminobutyrate hydrolase PuuD